MDKQKRLRKVFEILRAYPDGVSGEVISGQLGVSSRTIRSDMKILEKMIQGYPIFINSAPRKGYMMVCEQAFFADKFINDTLGRNAVNIKCSHEPADYIVCRLLTNSYTDTTVTQTYLADEMYISLSSLKSNFIECKQILSKYNIKIMHYKKDGIQIDGDENQVRNCIFDYIDKSDCFAEKIFAETDMISIDEVISKVLREREMQIPDTDKTSLCIHVAIAITRAQCGKSISYPISTVKKIDQTFEYNVAKDILEYLYAVLAIDVAYSEVYYITQCLLASKKFFNTATSGENLEAKKIVYAVLEKIKQELLIDFIDDEYLIDGLVLHLNIAINRIQFHMNIRNELLETIKNDYPLAFQMGVIASKVVKNLNKIDVNENEIGYIALHFGAALSRKGINEKICSAKKIIIACAAGLSIAVLLKAKIKEHFQNRLDILEVMPTYSITTEILKKVDYIFTTVPIDNIKSPKIITINNILQDDDIAKIEKIVFDNTSINKAYLQEFLKPRNFFTDKEFASKEDCIGFLTENAIQKGLMSEKTRASVYEREDISSTAIGNMVAVPHPIYNDMEVSFISVLILNKPIQWGNFLVQVVFLLSIKKGDNKLWETIFLKLNDYIRSKNGVESMLKNKSYDIFLHEFSSMF
ncbi:BglG family transcription antiterminator [Pectinatus haikarae]|uniref:BglG family transcription antiterminator n=1 Tax=Pectinatus haikarae TaxID=349096 RepID=UPI0018C811C6|nr:BglG family transcription antiterminator [Pectinatus haikarae]